MRKEGAGRPFCAVDVEVADVVEVVTGTHDWVTMLWTAWKMDISERKGRRASFSLPLPSGARSRYNARRVSPDMPE